MRTMFGNFHKIYRLADNPDYEPEASESVQAMMQAQGRSGLEVVYDLMMERNGIATLRSKRRVKDQSPSGDLDHRLFGLRHHLDVCLLPDIAQASPAPPKRQHKKVRGIRQLISIKPSPAQFRTHRRLAIFITKSSFC
jgi:hypothetical protein